MTIAFDLRSDGQDLLQCFAITIRNPIRYISTISIHFFSQVIYIPMQTYVYTSIYY